MSKKVIMVNGKKRSGKDFTATELLRQFNDLNVKIEQHSFAEPMKTIIAHTLGITTEQLEEFKNNSNQFNVHIIDYDTHLTERETNCREILQNFGSGGMKEVFGEDIWAMLGLQKVQDSDADIIVFSDFRFDKEYEIFKKALGKNLITIKVLGGDSGDTHISEQGTTNTFDYVIDNTEKLPTIFKDISEIVKGICNES